MPGYLLLLAFVLSQLIATFIAVYGFRGWPSDAGVQGIGWYWAVMAWIWSLLWVIPLDLIKIVSRYVMDPALLILTSSFQIGFKLLVHCSSQETFDSNQYQETAAISEYQKNAWTCASSTEQTYFIEHIFHATTLEKTKVHI